MLFLMLILIMLIPFFFMLLNLLFSKKMFLDREKGSPYECGFDLLSSPRLPFSIHFYLMGILFLIFDMEIIFLLPLIYLMNCLNFYEWMFLSLMILMILYLGLEYEKLEGSLKWIF